MVDIELAVGQEVIMGDTRIRCVEGQDCEKCVVHLLTQDTSRQVTHTDFWGRQHIVSTSMQCGGIDYQGYPNGRMGSFVCDKDSRRDGKDVIFVEVERLEPMPD